MNSLLSLSISVALVVFIIYSNNKKSKYILIALTGLYWLLVLNRRREGFGNYKKEKCNVQRHTSRFVNSYVDNICNVPDDESSSRVINNNRLNCREFESKKIFLDLDKKNWCNNITDKKKSQQLDLTLPVTQDTTVQPDGNSDYEDNLTNSNTNFPASIYTNLDNKLSE